MVFLRSLLFNIAFYLASAFLVLFWLPAFFIVPHKDGWKIAQSWAWVLLWLHQKITGSTYEFRGLENLPKEGGAIIAAKHQSAWETTAIILFLRPASYILKRGLMFIPVFGWFMAKMKVVPVNRGKRGAALAAMAASARKLYNEGQQIIIYPEGTRTAPGAKPAYKFGVVYLYDELDARVVPVALNSGLFWKRQSFMRYPGKHVIEFLPPIEPGLGRDAFAARLEKDIETATNAIMAETAGPQMAKVLKQGQQPA